MARGSANSCTVAERLRELGGFWHLWRAQLLEDVGEVPPELERCVAACISELVCETRLRLQDAMRACDETEAGLPPSTKCARSHATPKGKDPHGLDR